MAVTVIAEGLDILREFIANTPDRAARAASLALNQIASRSGLKLLQDKTEAEINFPAGYITNDNLHVSQTATKDNLQAAISARIRPTSLARFAAPGTPVRGSGGVTVQVHRGRSTNLKKAFLLKLANGNTGLAVRLGTGKTFENTTGAVEIESASTASSQLYLLYGPSVDQVFREIAEEQTPAILEMVSDEFIRQFNRNNL